MDSSHGVLPAHTLAVSVNRPSREVYEFVANPANLPQWAAGLGSSVERVGEQWIAETPRGKVAVHFVERNAFGVLDHIVRIAPGVEVYVPMRVLPNGGGCEVLFTLFQISGMSDQEFAGISGWSKPTWLG